MTEGTLPGRTLSQAVKRHPPVSGERNLGRKDPNGMGRRERVRYGIGRRDGRCVSKGRVVEPEMRDLKPHPLRWVVESLVEEPSYLEKAMFGCRGCYVHGRLVLVMASRGREPWRGLLVPTEKRHHPSLLAALPDLRVHPMLGKWLYLPQDAEGFEEAASSLAELILEADDRIGVLPRPRR